ncbi:MAG: acyltransferase family protein [Chlorobium sp.]|nr:acyltransferase family protein [Chlorobium sp.]
MNDIAKHNCVFSSEDTVKVKGVAILMMFAFHLFSFPERLPPDGYMSIIPHWPFTHTIEEVTGKFGGLCVPIFIFLSGYGLTRSFKIKSVSALAFLKKKFINFYIVYWAVFFLFMMPPIALRSQILGEWSFSTVALTLLGLGNWINGEWWFVKLYIILLIIFIPCLYLLEKNKTILAVIVTILFWFLPIFVIGMTFSLYNIFEKLPDLFPPTPSPKETGFIFATIFLLHSKQSNLLMDATYIPFFVFWASRISNEKINKILVVLGRHSFVMWLSHSFFCYYFFKNFIYSPKISILIFMLLVGVSLCTSIIINSIIKEMKIHLSTKTA